jgi:hypothetical protein
MTLLVYKEITINNVLEDFIKLITIKIHQADEEKEKQIFKEKLSQLE